MTGFPDDYPAALAAEVDSAFAAPSDDLHDEIEDHLCFGIDWDDIAIDVMAKATNFRATVAALLVFAPHLGEAPQ